MKQSFKVICLLLLAALLCVPAFAADTEPPPELTEVEFDSSAGIFQCGAVTGPQTIPGPAAQADDPEQAKLEALGSYLIEQWQKGWETLKDVPLDEPKHYDVDISSFELILPNNSKARSYPQPYHTFQKMLERIVNDNAEALFYADGYASIAYYPVENGRKLTGVRLTYAAFDGLTGAQAEARFSAAIDKALAQVNDQMPVIEKLLVLHDYILLNCTYNYEVAHKMEPPTSRVYKAYGALVDHDAVCSGYDLAYAVLLDRLGIGNACVGSGVMGHAWNLVEVDGAWYQADLTWDDAIWAEGGCRYSNFLLSDEAFQKTGHHDWDAPFPCTSTKYESGWLFNGAKSSVYRRDDGKYYAVRLAPSKITHTVFVSDKLNSTGMDLNTTGRDLHLNINHGTAWHDDFLYFIYWDGLTDVRTVAALQLDSGKLVQVGRVEPTKDITIGLRYEDGKIFLSDTDTVTWSRRYDFGSVPVLPKQTNAAPPILNLDDRFPVYYHNGKFYTLSVDRRDGSSRVDLTAGGSLADVGTNLGEQFSYIDPGTFDAVWEGDYLYCLYRENTRSTKTLMAVQLGTGKAIQIREFDTNGSNWVCLRYGNRSIVPYDKTSNQAICGGFPVLPAASDITNGIHVFGDGCFAILQKEPGNGQTLWAAQYTDGRMANLQQGTAMFTVKGHAQPDMTVIPLAGGAPGGPVTKCFLLGPDYAPVCPAVYAAAGGTDD